MKIHSYFKLFFLTPYLSILKTNFQIDETRYEPEGRSRPAVPPSIDSIIPAANILHLSGGLPSTSSFIFEKSISINFLVTN